MNKLWICLTRDKRFELRVSGFLTLPAVAVSSSYCHSPDISPVPSGLSPLPLGLFFTSYFLPPVKFSSLCLLPLLSPSPFDPGLLPNPPLLLPPLPQALLFSPSPSTGPYPPPALFLHPRATPPPLPRCHSTPRSSPEKPSPPVRRRRWPRDDLGHAVHSSRRRRTGRFGGDSMWIREVPMGTWRGSDWDSRRTLDEVLSRIGCRVWAKIR